MNDGSLVPANGSDAMTAAIHRVLQLQKERARRAKAIDAKNEAALAALRARLLANHKEIQRQREKSRAHRIMKIMLSVERRKDIEAQMKNVVLRLHSDVKRVEDMMMIGYHGREVDAKSSSDNVQREDPLAEGDL